MNKKDPTVAIVIPTHRDTLKSDEAISLNHLNHHLKRYDKFLVLPEKLKNKKVTFGKFKEVIYFDSSYFTSVAKYCELLNTKKFYLAFKKYDYVLIYQLDVAVFSDKLLEFCKKDFDYIGPPFFYPFIGFFTNPKNNSLNGANGGFSLRKVSSFLKVIDAVEKEKKRTSSDFKTRYIWFIQAILTLKSHKKWLNAPATDYPFNEDGFWSYEAPKYVTNFKVAPLHEALKFGFERFPRRCFRLNGNKLPFGVHVFAKYDRNFWEPYLIK